MYRILSESKSTYITDKYIKSSRSIDANVGQAGTIDLFKLQDEASITGITGSIRELSRGLIQFDYSPIQELTSSALDINDSSFKCLLSLKSIYGGQTVPSNFTLALYPVAKKWDEGRGFDVVSYRDLDAANFVTASKSSGIVLWDSQGAAASGSIGDANVDIFVSGNLGAGSSSLGVTQTFKRGDEDLLMDITDLVSASLAGIYSNNGFRLSFIDKQENDSKTRFVKRFATGNAYSKALHPKLIVKYDDTIEDNTGNLIFGVSQSLFTYNYRYGSPRNFFSGSTAITGANSLIVELAASHSVTYPTRSWSPSHSMSIDHTTSSMAHFSTTFSASQYSVGSIFQTGIYKADVNLNPHENALLRSFMSSSNQIGFDVLWKSIDTTVTYSRDFVTFKKDFGTASNTINDNLLVNIINLNETYQRNQKIRPRVIVQDYNTSTTAYRYPVPFQSVIVPDMRWRLLNAYDRSILIPFDSATKLSTDKEGMYFDLWLEDLPPEEVYELEFVIKNRGGKDVYVTNRGFRFKVTK